MRMRLAGGTACPTMSTQELKVRVGQAVSPASYQKGELLNGHGDL
jgi:hypothetical protein